MKIVELHLLTNDIPSTREFYSRFPGIELLEYTSELVRLKAGNSLLIFHLSAASEPFYHFAFNIYPGQLEQALIWAKAHVTLIPVENENLIADFKSWNAKAFYFFDNNRNIVELIARFDLPLPNEQPTPSIASIGEIGIVVDDVPAFCEQLINKEGLAYFSKQQPLHDFAAIGDDEGLLIVASNNRNWYPTQLPSSKHWLKLTGQINTRPFTIEMGA